MDFSEFKRRLGAEPRSVDPELLRARNGGPEYTAAAEEAETFECLLERAIHVPAPGDLVDSLQALTGRAAPAWRRAAWPAALAAGLLLAFGAAMVFRQAFPRWESLEAYVTDHYQHDGVDTLARYAAGEIETDPADVRALFARFAVDAAPALRDVIGVIKICPTPGGKGLHMVLNTAQGLATVIYMPDTAVADREQFRVGDQRALLVEINGGSAVIIGENLRDPAELYAFVQESLRPRTPPG